MANKQAVFICSDCGCAIYAGNFYLDVLNEQYCLGCTVAHFRYAVKLDESVTDDETE